VLEKLGAGFARSSDIARARQLTRRLMGEVGARMLILDEINHMLACTPRQQRIFLNTIRYLANDLRIPLICTGNHEARAALLTDAALADRFDSIELVAWRDDEQFRLLMVTLAAILPLKKPSPLADDEFRAKVLGLTDGNTGRIFRLIENLAIRAIGNGKETIGPEDLDADDLILPTVTMKQIAQRQGKQGAGAVRAV
ncbi:MAG: transposase, partial [Alphaproteobacteria bacterium]